MQSTRELIVEPVGMDVETLPRRSDGMICSETIIPWSWRLAPEKARSSPNRRTRPDVNFVGIEWARWFWRYASDRLRRNHCQQNARTVRADAAFFFSEFVMEQSLSVVHIYFPDPWPKKRTTNAG